MSNKLLEVFDWATAPSRVDEAHQPPSGNPPSLEHASGDAVAHASRWTKQRLIVVTRRMAVVLMVLLCLGLSVFGYVWSVTPSTADLATLARAQAAAHHASYTTLSAITPQMAQAVVAIEDEHFYQHHGIDTIGLARAAWDDLRAGRLVEGAARSPRNWPSWSICKGTTTLCHARRRISCWR